MAPRSKTNTARLYSIQRVEQAGAHSVWDKGRSATVNGIDTMDWSDDGEFHDFPQTRQWSCLVRRMS